MKSYIDIAIKAIYESGNILIENLGSINSVEYKGDIINIVTNVDKESERKILDIILKEYPNHQILTEEKGNVGLSEYKWIIDPLDGTTNYAHTFPCFAISIALEIRGEVVIGIVYNPINNELFISEKNGGAYLNGKRIFVSKVSELDKSLLATGFPYDRRKRAEDYLVFFKNFMKRSHGIRRTGAASLDLCYLAMGRVDGFWEIKLSPWDTAAGSLIIKEGGGIITDFFGSKFNIYKNNILASNGRIHSEMLKIVELSFEESNLNLYEDNPSPY
jgi:myo-inositol-1(or 4)-monophosphatase